MNYPLTPERLGTLQKLIAAMQQGEQMVQQGQAIASQARKEAEAFIKDCATLMDLDYPDGVEFKGDGFVAKAAMPVMVAGRKEG
jgi:hypothetical protein